MDEGFLGGFEWDEEKREQTYLKHGVDFADLAGVLEGNVLVSPSKHDDELRWIAIGLPSDC